MAGQLGLEGSYIPRTYGKATSGVGDAFSYILDLIIHFACISK